jgi:dethiobiotin synthetase
VTRPTVLVFVTGTGTDIGKTWWTAEVVRELRARALVVAARKPAQSGPPGVQTDADVLAEATGEPGSTVCAPARTYPLAWAPPMAASELGAPSFTIAELVRELEFPPETDVAFVEGAGGPRSPFTSDGDNVDFAAALAPDLVALVADAGLGTINAVRLSVAAFAGPAFATVPIVVALNRYVADGLPARNRDVLVGVDHLDVVTCPSELADRVERAARREPRGAIDDVRT